MAVADPLLGREGLNQRREMHLGMLDRIATERNPRPLSKGRERSAAPQYPNPRCYQHRATGTDAQGWLSVPPLRPSGVISVCYLFAIANTRGVVHVRFTGRDGRMKV